MSMSTARAAVLDALRRSGRTCSVRELAREFDLHPNTVREHLDALVEEGLAARETSAPSGRGRPALVYRAVSGDRDAARDYQLLAEVLAEQVASMPDPQEASVSAGQAWGRRMLASGEYAPGAAGVQQAMARMGFDPTAPDENGDLVLRSCPILGAARRRPEVVCAVHTGLARALVEAGGGDPSEVDVVPMALPAGCLVRLPTPETD